MTRNIDGHKKTEISIFWFRRDFRLNDNAGLFEALKNSDSVVPLFIFDTEILEKLPGKEDKRVVFIHRAISKLQNELLKIGSSILVMHGNSLTIFNELLTKYAITSVFANSDYEPSTIERDNKILDLLKSKGVTFKLLKDHVIFEKSEILKEDGCPFKMFTPYSKAWKHKLNEEKIKTFASEGLLHNFCKTKPIQIPTLDEIGFKNIEINIPQPIIDKNIIRHYHETRNSPFLKGTSNLSVHLRFGTISIRELVKISLDLNEQFLNELIWREFFMMILYHHPYVANECFKKQYNNIVWRNNEEEFKRWCLGETGYPIVDAGMRELNETGFMHNRVRMIVASFLTKHLLIDWRWGEAYFAEKLLDFELSSNNGNWQWAAGCGCDAAPYFRIFNPYEQIKKFDANLIYTKKWVKNLNKTDYPTPIIEHKYARERFLKLYKTTLESYKK
ncbi:MAG: deoxyribodipyrimidine photo-lyase [Bacteroidota bacterium]|nr:deoxyribodipyrimidine photo-lyase [Bacteroidota bacterium]